MTDPRYRKVIFDASSLIAVITKEKGYEDIKPYLPSAIMSTVNVSEVYKYCIETQDMTKDECKLMLKISSIEISPFTDEEALISASLIAHTKKHGISLADRACLALSISTGFPIVTCDRIWQKLNLDVQIICPR